MPELGVRIMVGREDVLPPVRYCIPVPVLGLGRSVGMLGGGEGERTEANWLGSDFVVSLANRDVEDVVDPVLVVEDDDILLRTPPVDFGTLETVPTI